MNLSLKLPNHNKLISKIIAVSLLLLSNQINAQNTNEKHISIGSEVSFESTILNEERTIWVHIPESDPDYDEAFPVLYLLDGDTHFTSVVGTVTCGSTNGNSIFPKMIVVGILNTDRLRDLTPKHGNKENGPNTSGGGSAFLEFIQKELIPFVENKYPTKPYRLFIGHSLGGLTVINAMLKQPYIFNSYIALDPSLWWSDSTMLEEAKMILNNKNLSDESLFVAIANTLSGNMTLNTAISDRTQQTQHIRDILEFSTKVVPESTAELNFKYHYYQNEGHGSLPLVATYDALRYIFSWYELDKTYIPLIINPEIKAGMVIKTLKTHYQIVSSNMGYTILPPESLVNRFGYGCLNRELYDKAESFFKLNIKNYPNSSNVYDSMGDYYVKINEIDKAILAYKKAMNTGNGNSYSQEKLQTLLLKEKTN